MSKVTFDLEQLIVLPGQSILLKDVSWQEFESALSKENRITRLAYDQGTLEIMVPLPEHEYFKEAIGDLVKDLAFELQVSYESLGSTTWKRESSGGGAEPDNCFYIQSLRGIQNKLNIDLDKDPPPDLILEIDITSKSLDSLPIYARLGVPEVWRYHRGQIRIYRLVDGSYVETPTSLAFPNFPVKSIPDFIRQNLDSDRLSLRRAFSAWVKRLLEQRKGNEPQS
jgi:Uma2 family endonuclease